MSPQRALNIVFILAILVSTISAIPMDATKSGGVRPEDAGIQSANQEEVSVLPSRPKPSGIGQSDAPHKELQPMSGHIEVASEEEVKGPVTRTRNGVPYRSYEYHRDNAIRLQGKAPNTLKSEDRKELSKTRTYLRHMIIFNGKHNRHPDKVQEAKTLFEGLQGGEWSRYKGPMGEDEVWRKTRSEQVAANRKELRERAQQGVILKPKKRQRRSNEENPKRKEYDDRYKAKHSAIYFEKYKQEQAGGLTPPSVLETPPSTGKSALETSLQGWQGRRQRTQRYLVP